jgi:hypothetical protein
MELGYWQLERRRMDHEPEAECIKYGHPLSDSYPGHIEKVERASGIKRRGAFQK